MSSIRETLFIQLGMTKEKWPQITEELVQAFLDDSALLDAESNEDFVECFYKYFEWYWA